MSDFKYYRPEWTCGRYNSKAHASIFYNLIEGMSYYFDEDSADVIGAILSVSRNEEVNVQNIVESTGIAKECIIEFFEELVGLNILTNVTPDKDLVAIYREQTSKYNCEQSQTNTPTTIEKLPFAISSAELEYTEKVGGITSVMFELTYNCSEKCIHCYNPGATRNDEEQSHRGDRNELSINDYKRIIDQLYDKGLIKVCLSGGDPFSKPIVWEILDYLYEKEIAIDIFTNGLRITNDTHRLVNYYPRLVGISLYSGIPEEHDYITRVKGSWEKTISVVRELSSLSVPMNIKCCIMRPNVKHYWMVNDIAQKYGAVPQFEINITDSLDGDQCARNLRLTPEELDIVLRDDNIKLYVGPEAPNFGGQPKDLENAGCGAANNTFCISPEGYMMPCCSFHLKFGSLKEKSVEEILTSDELKKLQHLTLHDYEDCGRFEYCSYCNLCPGLNYLEHGTPTKASENCCYTAKIRHSLAIRMMKGYDPLHGKTVKECLADFPDYKAEKLHRTYTHFNNGKRQTDVGK